MRRNTVLLGLRDRLPNYTRQIQIRFGRCNLGQNSNRASLFSSVEYRETIANNLSKAGWNLGCLPAVDCEGRTVWIADAHRDDGKRFVVRADEKLMALLELHKSGHVLHINNSTFLDKAFRR
jgi:hypothetical protein